MADRLIAVWIGCRNVFVYPPNKDFLKLNVKSFLESFFNKFQFVFKKIERGNLERIAKKMLGLFSLKYVELALSDLTIFKHGKAYSQIIFVHLSLYMLDISTVYI